MAAATAPTMVCFLDVDPSFQVVMNAISELYADRCLPTVCTITAGNSGLRSASNNDMFGGHYGFSRTLGSTLRAFMLRSTYMNDLHDPTFEGKLPNLSAALPLAGAGYYRNTQPPDVQPNQLPLVHDVGQARNISANFDRLYPHFLIENELAAVDDGGYAYIPGMMVIVEQRAGDGKIVKLHQINVKVRAKYIGPGPADPNLKQYECPDPNVVRITSSVLDLPKGKTEDDFPHFKLLKHILNVKKMPDEDVSALVEKLKKVQI